MLEKNKDYIEMRVSSTDFAFTQNEPVHLCVEGLVYATNGLFPGPGEDYILISKEKFDRLQADDQHYRELAKQREHNYELLLTMTGFNTLEELTNYIHDAGKNSKGGWKTLKEIADDAEEDYISERDKAEALKIENEKLKNKLHEYDPFSDFKELFKKLYSIEDTEALEWALNHTVGGRGSVNGWRAVSSFWSEKYKTLSKLVGFSSVEEIQDYLTNEAECDTLHEAFVKKHHRITVLHSRNRNLVHMLKKEWRTVRELQDMLCDWTSATGCGTPEKAREHLSKLEREQTKIVYLDDSLGVIAKWQKVTGYNEPKDFLKWKANIEGIMEAWKSATGCKYPAEARILLEKWKTLTKCETPEAATTWITSYESACERGNNLARKVEEWKEATDCPSPSSAKTLLDHYCNENKKWQKATGCISPEDISTESLTSKCVVLEQEVKILNNDLMAWKEFTGYPNPSSAKTAIESGASWHHAYNESKEVNKKFADSIKAWQNVTGYSTPEDYLAAVIKNTAKGILSWQEITGFSTPEKCSAYIDILEKKLEEIKNLIEED